MYCTLTHELENVKDADCLVFAVAHEEFKSMNIQEIEELFADIDNSEKVIIDVKSILTSDYIKEMGYSYWCL